MYKDQQRPTLIYEVITWVSVSVYLVSTWGGGPFAFLYKNKGLCKLIYLLQKEEGEISKEDSSHLHIVLEV